ncbi:MAG TPA: c-type cytochrome [Woeseiaceae bacterium]|nr:c-type cytochrome [Woeseiaceae bacterium]
MKNTLAYVFALAGISLAALQVQAESLVDGSAEDGKSKAVTCAACHGADGISVNPLWPNLAGQGAPYLVAQLSAFKNGSRGNPLMTSQAMMLSEQDMADLAVYFEGLPAPAQAVADPDLVGRGEALYRGGDVTKQVAACIACHGPTGAGNPAAAYPALKGQHAAYTAKQLRDYASGERVSDGKTRIMRDIAGKLSAAEIDALASYVQGLK